MNRLDEARKIAQVSMEKYGWYVHVVPDHKLSPTGINYHTHGFEETFNHLNMEIVLPVSITIAYCILSIIADRLFSGSKFETDRLYSEIVEADNVTFVNSYEGGRNLLRLILPDTSGNLHNQESIFKEQWRLPWGLNSDQPVKHINRSELNLFDPPGSCPPGLCFKTICPSCDDGILFMHRCSTTCELQSEDCCSICGQRFLYTDID